MIKVTRRRILAAAGVAAIATTYPLGRKIADHLTPLPEFEPITDPAGFRRVAGGSSSLGRSAFAGLDGPSHEASDLPIAKVRDSICTALYGEDPLAPETVPVASISDFYCPYCRVQTKELARLEERLGDTVRIAWHELPLLGETSLLAARAWSPAARSASRRACRDRRCSSGPAEARPRRRSHRTRRSRFRRPA
ncbi:DsbA family protein [Mameliella sp. CS4]|uniref:DsbA family protein n=1 Tax=Mameliella sp. CS4 TaxID=2862329 RepID=UPI0021041D08|nr:DsbA family protein [Mameliella sp. CS4]